MIRKNEGDIEKCRRTKDLAVYTGLSNYYVHPFESRSTGLSPPTTCYSSSKYLSLIKRRLCSKPSKIACGISETFRFGGVKCVDGRGTVDRGSCV